MQFARHFRLSDAIGRGVRCDESGLYVGATPLLKCSASPDGRAAWRPRLLADLNRDLGETYGAPVTLAAKLGGLASVARALDRGDLAHAQVAALLLGLPDPRGNAVGKSMSAGADDLAAQLKAAGVAAASLDEASETPSRSEKFNPYHDERGRFTDAGGAVSDSNARAVSDARGGGADKPAHAGSSFQVNPNAPVAAPTRVALVQRFSCLDAFRACVQDAIFASGRSTAGCTADLATCKSTGLPKIFAPGIVGQR